MRKPNEFNSVSWLRRTFPIRLVKTILQTIAFTISSLGLPLNSPAQPALLNVLHSFDVSPDGASPVTPLALGSNHKLYGTTSAGGTNSSGVLFSMNLDGTAYLILHHFDTGNGTPNGGGVIEGLDLRLYGTTSLGTDNGGTVFSVQRDGQNFTVLHTFTNGPDGSRPMGEFTQASDGVLFGVTHDGGLGDGTIYSMNPDGSGYQVLYSFHKVPDGSQPSAGLLLSGGMLYGTTGAGGATSGGGGTVFKISPAGTGYQVLHSFTNQPDGYASAARLVQGSDGALYGTTVAGGTASHGTVFKLDTDGNNFTILHSFTNTPDAVRPDSGVVRGWDNALYGTTFFGGGGGPPGFGAIYRVFENGTGYQVVYAFTNTVYGYEPYAALAQGPSTPGSAGIFYGMTESGGSFGNGVVFGLVVNPPLSITPVSSGPTLFWPAWAINYTLQHTTNLTSGPWTTVTNGAPITGVQLPDNATNSSADFYRLIWLP